MNRQHAIEQLFNTMGQLKKLFESTTQDSHEEKAATFMQFAGLKFLKDTKNSTVGDLAVHLRLSKSSATQLTERLEKARLVHRKHDKVDRRIVHLIITREGKQKILDLKKKFISKMSRSLSKIPNKDINELVRIHTLLIETLQKQHS